MKVQEFADVFDALADTPAEAADLKARSDLLITLIERVKKWEFSRTAVAKRLGISRIRMDDLLRGKLSKFSLDDLANLTMKAGLTSDQRGT